MDVKDPSSVTLPSVKKEKGISSEEREGRSLLNKLRQEMMLEITFGEKRVGTSKEISEWILKKYQENAYSGDICQAVLYLKEDYVSPSNELPTIKAAFEQHYALEHYPIPEFFFVSTDYESEPVGFLFQREALKGGGRVYSVTGFNLCGGYEKVSRSEFRIKETDPEPFVSLMQDDGWAHTSKEMLSENNYIELIFRCLAAYSNYRHPRIDNKAVVDTRSIKPKDNEYLVQLICKAIQGKVTCTRISLPINRIKPRDIDYALNIPEADIQDFMRRIAEWGAPLAEILLYEEDGQLMMDDDYLAYCAYRTLKIDSVKAVVIGNFDESDIKILKRGRGELIPPVIVDRAPKKMSQDGLSKDHMLDERLSSLMPTPNSRAQMKMKFTNFCRLLGRDSTLEKDLQNFIKHNPEIFDSHFGRMHMEVPIGNFRADMVLQYEQSHRRVLLVELERHVDQIFTKDNRLRSKVTHASQQVEDWIGEIRSGKNNIPDWLKREYVVEGAVVIGRSKNLTVSQKDTLRVINTNRIVKIMTYDDLLEQMMRLISIL